MSTINIWDRTGEIAELVIIAVGRYLKADSDLQVRILEV